MGIRCQENMESAMNWPMGKSRGRIGGFTLVEIMIVLFIMVVVVSAVYALFVKSQRTYTGQDQLVQLQQDLRSALEMMAQELRQAGYDPAIYVVKNPRPGIEIAEPQRIRFTADLNGNGVIDGGDERVTYVFKNGALYRNDGSGDQEVTPNLVDFQIRYFLLADGTFRGILSSPPRRDFETQNPEAENGLGGSPQDRREAIRVIRLEARGRTPHIDPDTKRYGEYTLKVDVALRNLAYRY